MSTEETIELSAEAKALLRAGGSSEEAPTGSNERLLRRFEMADRAGIGINR